MRIHRITTGLAAIAVAVLLGACADESADPGGTPDPTPPMPTPSSPATPVTVTGEVIAGVEAGCVLLVTDQEEYLLVGDEADDLEVGTTATVRGRVAEDTMSICQQGTPFTVEEVLSP